MDLKLLHIFTVPGGKQGRGSAGRTHVLTLYINIFPPPTSHSRFLHSLHYTLGVSAALDCVENISIFPPQPTRQGGAAVSSLVSSGQQMKAENLQPHQAQRDL